MYVDIRRRTHPTSKQGQEKTVFISYASEDFQQADRLYKDLKNAGLNPWLGKYNLLPGQNRRDEIKNAIKQSRYFISLFSSISVKKVGDVQTEFKFALDVFKTYPPGMIFYIPVRLDGCEIPYKELEPFHRANLFPVDDDNIWKTGLNQILRAIGVVITCNDGSNIKYTQDIHNHVVIQEYYELCKVIWSEQHLLCLRIPLYGPWRLPRQDLLLS